MGERRFKFHFDYAQAFSRNLGWLTEQEQESLRSKTVAIAGLGGVGGHHLLALTRLGVGRFHLADHDHFELANFNRQVGATVDTLGLPKARTMAELAKAINPELAISVWDEGVQDDTLDAFLEGVDLYVDGLDFFAFDTRQATFAACRERGIPALTAAPLGMGTSWTTFMPDGMDFESCFRWQGKSDAGRAASFAVGMAPRLRLNYLVDPARLDFQAGTAPSTTMACHLCAGVAATEALKLLLGRGKVCVAPSVQHFDAYRMRMARTWNPWGNAHPLRRLKIALVQQRFSATRPELPPPAFTTTDEEITRAYSAPAWWYDLRGILILTFAHRNTVLQLARFFAANIADRHLELACGTGSLLRVQLWLARFKGNKGHVTGVDLAPSMLKGAARWFRRDARVRLMLGDVTRLPFDEASFDSANLANALHCFSQPDQALAEVARVLRPGGQLAANILLHPSGWLTLRKLSQRINAWGIRKGLLVTPFSQADAVARIRKAGFEIESANHVGNCLYVLARRGSDLGAGENLLSGTPTSVPCQAHGNGSRLT